MAPLPPCYNKITNNIYIGNIWAPTLAINDGINHKITPITHIISLIPHSETHKSFFADNNVKYYEHCFADNIDQNIIEHFNIMADSIRKILLENNSNILYVCQAGKSRSVSIVILTLMHFYDMNFLDAFKLISSKRETQINRRFYSDLLNYEK